jgi:hypothetical protein
MDSTLLPEDLDDFGTTTASFHGVQGEGTELALQLNVMLGIGTLLPGASEMDIEDFPQATKPGEQFINPSVAHEEGVGMYETLRTDVDDLAGSPLAADSESPFSDGMASLTLAAQEDAMAYELTGNPLAAGSEPHVH